MGNEGNNENLKFIISDYSDFEGAEKTAKMIEENFGKIDTVIACVGGWWSGGPIWKVNEESWKNHFLGLATTHMALAKAWVSRLDKSGSYQIISGGSGKHAVEGSGIVSMQHAALIMMAEALGLEAKDSRVFAFVLGVVNSRNRPAHKSYWITAEQVGMVSTILAKDELLASQIIEIKDKADLPDVLDKLIQ
ncbi:SDR family oxidoreductase [Chryseobacterium sp.]|uniref:SDR family oxidoreductase n=1 Tax=Chryseobacterium sp. TaxID=1871047 RepID=UPI00388E0FC5